MTYIRFLLLLNFLIQISVVYFGSVYCLINLAAQERRVDGGPVEVKALVAEVAMLAGKGKYSEAQNVLSSADVTSLARRAVKDNKPVIFGIAGLDLVVNGVNRVDIPYVNKYTEIFPCGDDVIEPDEDRVQLLLWRNECRDWCERFNRSVYFELELLGKVPKYDMTLDDVKREFFIEDNVWASISDSSKLAMRSALIVHPELVVKRTLPAGEEERR
jgi:hypothetical protein